MKSDNPLSFVTNAAKNDCFLPPSLLWLVTDKTLISNRTPKLLWLDMGSMAVFLFSPVIPSYTELIAGYGVMSSKRPAYAGQNSHIPHRDMQKISKHCLRSHTGPKSDHFSCPKNDTDCACRGDIPWPLVLLLFGALKTVPETAKCS